MTRPAARVDDNHVCPLTTPPPHVGGLILPPGGVNTIVNGHHAARVSDKAFCVAPAPDTVRGGLISVFVDGNPFSRLADKTDVGNIVVGSPDVLLGEWGGGPLTPYQAQWLYDYMSKQENIPFEYATDGCFARADRMAELIGSLDIPVQKQWVWDVTGNSGLNVPIANYPGGGVSWRYHVAPVVQVAGTPGGMIIDPSMRPGGPISVADWTSRMNPNGVTTATTATGTDVYYQPYDPSTNTWGTPQRSAPTARDLENYRGERARLPASSGRNVPNAPVHY